ncbi:DUF1836 domain-containing protein [Clostridium tagluense]|uniref:DUF1836 domain-containing protein n=1 Tax=Clostridium tagluense TaxID=360422 RepID=A0A401UGI3_9CLOT|nr:MULTISPECIES: DUF1836 domain-containing protein [Clostridium]MBU3127307.1 DUF1836 domain-containing protein [Clostridium tagluense]MBW9155398.1 DUF1836 domain-containing protein [Clostridium tagluense]MBZ9621708.1 DUF1836 domain-containing protein [Clostridium sp. FP2]MCB2298974.1 DUF1836 domain-containing protein [Clostridium tagluense]MCB2311219.1 DUF1836 domain-containing protein [Clostridium tagluense]
MDYNKESLDKLVEEIIGTKDITLMEIPCVDLYMDQVTTFFNEKLGSLKRNDDDKILTKTMINNYTKGKVLMPAKNKKYTNEHMILLMLIYNLKQSISINDINIIFDSIIDMKAPKGTSLSLENLYNSFLDIKEVQNQNFVSDIDKDREFIKGRIKEMGKADGELIELILMVLLLINKANMQKRMAEKLIDNFLNKK